MQNSHKSNSHNQNTTNTQASSPNSKGKTGLDTKHTSNNSHLASSLHKSTGVGGTSTMFTNPLNLHNNNENNNKSENAIGVIQIEN